MIAARFTAFATCCVLVSVMLFPANARGGSAIDDGAEPRVRNEVWRLCGRLKTADGRAFDYAATFFRYVPRRGPALYPAAVSIVDETNERHFQERRTERDALGLADASSTRLAVHVGDWSLSESATARPVRTFDLVFRLANGSLRLHGSAEKPRLALPSDSGGHYAYTSIRSTGTLALEDGRFEVTGKSWLDHETQDAAAPAERTRLGRFFVQLDDGREILIETSKDEVDGSQRNAAYLIRRDGTVETLAPSDYEFGNHLATTWLSTHTQVRYPDLWALSVDGETELMSLEPIMFDQEATAGGNGESFWDGAVDVYDESSQGQRLGSGYALLVGYAAAGPPR